MKNIIHSAILTSLIFILLFVVNVLPINSDFLDPLQQAFKDFELTDIVYSQLLDEAPKRIDTDIVLVNIGELGRKDIAKVIRRVMSIKPKIAGLDARFWEDADSVETKELVDCINSYDNFVLAEHLIKNDDSISSIRLGLSHDSLKNKTIGYDNFPAASGSFRTVRSIIPFEYYNGIEHAAFAVKIAEIIAPDDVAYLRARDNQNETINYQKRQTCISVDFTQILDLKNSNDFIKDKIVLFGYLGRSLYDKNSYEDRYFTPLNKRYAGKSFPDMFGVQIHGNILSMILHRDYVNSMSFGVNTILSWFFCFFVVFAFTWVDDRFPHYYDLISKTLQILTIVLLLFVVIICFDDFRYRFDSALAALAIAIAADGYQIYASALSARQHSITSKKSRLAKSISESKIPTKTIHISRKERKRKR
jgi:CHASE2 domain-containing sensor protein